MTEKYNWTTPVDLGQNSPPKHGDVRLVTIPVKVAFIWSDKIVADYDEETETVLEYKSGFIMSIIPEEIVYRDEPSQLLYHASAKK